MCVYGHDQVGYIDNVSAMQTHSGTARLLPAHGQGTKKNHMNDTGKRGIVYNHFPKAGGSFIRYNLQYVVPNTTVKIENEFETLQMHDLHNFTIGSIRNPCSWYVSYYHYAKKGGSALRAGRSRYNKFVPAYYYNSKGANATLFFEWLQYITGQEADQDKIGVMSVNYAQSYVAGYKFPCDGEGLQGHKHSRKGRICEVRGHLRNVGDSGFAAYKAALAIANFSVVDCWVHTENATRDFRECLKTYEQQSDEKVEWALLDHNAKKRIRTNPTTHLPCSEFYNVESERFVRRIDRSIFDLFGFSSCC